jgi:hypothetical protein
MPAERMPPTPEVMQIFEGTDQIQRMVIARDLAASHANDPTGRITCR